MSTQIQAIPNAGKSLTIEVGNETFSRIPIRTHVITEIDDITSVTLTYAQPLLNDNDLLFISEKIVAISQGRAFKIEEIKTTRLARTLSSFVHRSPYGIGIGSPHTMQLAITEAGAWRILIAAAVSAMAKLFGIKGIFYHIAGHNVNAIDGPCSYTLPPYNGYAKLGPLQPNKVARELKEILGNDVVIIDANDLGVTVLGKSSRTISDNFCKQVFKDNPLGQSTQQTPLCIVRKM